MVLDGKPTVFLSVSEEHKERVAYPIRDELYRQGLRVIIVSDEPLLARTGSDPNAKVNAYLEASDAVVALCTPDSQIAGTELQPRLNIIDEIQRAQSLRHLVNKTMVLKARGVRLPSNINPTYGALDMDAPAESTGAILRQMREWGVLSAGPLAAEPLVDKSDESTDQIVGGLAMGLHIGEPKKAMDRVFRFVLTHPKSTQRRVVERLLERVANGSDGTEGDGPDLWVAAELLEALVGLDPGLLIAQDLEPLSEASEFSVRAVAADLLWSIAEIAPGQVPLDIVARLARPEEDWYVYSPAMAAAKHCLISRPEAAVIFEHLARRDSDARFAAADALLNVSRIDARVVPPKLARQLSLDGDPLVAAKGRELLEALPSVSGEEWAHPARKFWL